MWDEDEKTDEGGKKVERDKIVKEKEKSEKWMGRRGG